MKYVSLMLDLSIATTVLMAGVVGLGSVALFAWLLKQTGMDWEHRQVQHLGPQEWDDLAHVPNTGFRTWMLLCRHENPTITVREAAVLYMLKEDFFDQQLEEEEEA